MSKRGGEMGGDSESAKKQKMEDDGQSDAALSPFAEATKFRSFKLIIEGKSIFVNPHFMGDFSSHFDSLCFGKFAETQKGEAKLRDAKYDDVIEMLNVLGADTRERHTDINMSNCAPMLLMAHKWGIDALQLKCEHFIEFDFKTTKSNFANTMKILMACERDICFPDSLLHIVASRLAAFGRRMLMEQQVGHAIEQELFVAILIASTRMSDSQTPELDHDYFGNATAPCHVEGCGQVTDVCGCCGHAECGDHEFLCPEKASSYQTAHTEYLEKNSMNRTPYPKKLY